MPEPEELLGANEPEDATQEIDPEEILLQDDEEETGEEEEADTEPEGEEAEQEPEDRLEKAFAKKWTAWLEKKVPELREEIREELRRETVPQQRASQQTGEIPLLSDAEAERLADQLNTSPEHVRILYALQMRDIAREREIQGLKSGMYEASEKSQAQQYVQEIAKNNPAMPGWDEKKLEAYRQAYQRAYGHPLPWREAYRQYVADAAMSGDFTRKTQQQTIQKIKARDQATVNIKAPSTKKPDVWDIPGDQFERLVDEVKSGKYKKS